MSVEIATQRTMDVHRREFRKLQIDQPEEDSGSIKDSSPGRALVEGVAMHVPTGHQTRNIAIETTTDESNLTYLHDELMLESFLHLPVKSLACCKCVSKPWYSLISGRSFLHQHLLNGPEKPNILFVPQYLQKQNKLASDLYVCSPDSVYRQSVTTIWASKLPHPTPSSTRNPPVSCGKSFSVPFRVRGSCNGIICLTYSSASRNADVVLFNPITGESHELPQIEEEWDGVYGIGYDHIHDDYKVITVQRLLKSPHYNSQRPVKVYSLSRNSWRSVDFIRCCGFTFSSMAQGWVLKGAVHWFTFTKELQVQSSGQMLNTIIAIDIVTEKSKYIQIPLCEVDVAGDRWFELCVLEECLCLAISSSGDVEVPLDIWQMKEYGNAQSWTKLFSLSAGHLVNSDWLGGSEDVLPLWIFSSGEVLIHIDDTGFFMYNPKSGEWNCLDLDYGGDDVNKSFRGVIHVNSLISPLPATAEEQ